MTADERSSTSAVPRFNGKLELTWTNKDRRLLAHPDDTYEWVAAADERVAEVRLLNDVACVGETNSSAGRHADNLLIRGDALHGLTSIASLPEFAADLLGKVRLCYIEPPFNTGRAFAQYDDALQHSVWLTMMRDRLRQIHRLLANDGVVWVHLDDAEVHRARVVLDEEFGANNYRNTVIWRRTTGKSAAVHNLGTMHDTLLVYAKTDSARFRPQLLPYGQDYLREKYSNEDERGRFMLDNLTASGVRQGDSGDSWQGVDVTTKKLHWRAPQADKILGADAHGLTTRQKLDALLDAGYIQLPRKLGGLPRFKRYLADTGGVAMGDLWSDVTVLNSQSKERLGFDTQKPEALLERIISVATDPGDVVVDCFAGSATTAAVAHKMGRRWVAIERSKETLAEYAVPRLTRVVRGLDASGATSSNGWRGGGGFRVLDVHPSMFERVDGRVVVASWATNGKLAQAVAAQAAFNFDPAAAPFCGAKGKTRLAVVDGLLSPEVVSFLVDWLDDDELLSVYGTAVDPDVRAALAALRRGSEVKKIPQSILDDYRRSGRDRTGAIDWPTVLPIISAEGSPGSGGS